ncbi:MAG TPA: inositol monophosphatase family protein [Actinomycetota bacterium]|nr:inositol monophosphatase family protein [Actinomycetota bacterium]
MIPDYVTELRFARELAALGAKLAMGHFRRDPEVKQKRDGTWVTEADWKVEAQIRLRIARTFPEHNVLGEEEGLTASGGGEPVAGCPTWVVDPIDGTNNFIAGIPIWATLIALRVDGRNVVGAVNAPAIDEAYEAARGAGARFNGDAISVDDVDELSDATVVSTGIESFMQHGLGEFYEDLATRSYRTRGFADFWGHALVARGAAHVMVESQLHVWDVAPLQVIVEEAGGTLTHLDGREWRDYGSCLSCVPSLHGQVVELMRRHAPGFSDHPGL